MYCDFYQLSERPFNVTPDPKFLYLNARYREAIASLNYGITQRKGFITLIGEAGTGKTTLLNKLLEELDRKTKSVFIFNTHVTFEEILEYIFAEFDLPVHNGKKLYMLQRLNSFLLEELRGGGNVALLIDEAQDLEFSVLEDLRLLSNLETAKEKILQIVLSGQPELGQKLSNPILRQLRQRIGINCRLLPLSRDEITEYIQYRLQAAGCPDLKLFSREAEEQIYHFSRGIPRLVNVVCDNALVIGYALGKKRIGADVITEAAADLLSVEPTGEPPVERPIDVAVPPPPTTRPQSRWRARFGVIALVVVAVVVGLLSVGRTMLQRRAEAPQETARAPRPLEVIRPGSEPRGSGVELPRANERSSAPLERPPDGVRDNADGMRDAAERDPNAVGAPERPRPEAEEPAAPSVAAGAAAQRPASADVPPVVPAAESAHAGSAPGVVAAAPHAISEEPLPEAPPAKVEKASASEARRDLPAVAGAARVEPAKSSAPVAAPVQNAAVDRGASAPAPLAAPHAAALPAVTEDEAREERSAPGRAASLDGVQFSTLIVRPGDSMSSIALRKYGQTSYTVLDLLKLANPDLKDINLITVGQSIRLPELGDGFPMLNDGTGHYTLLVYTTPHSPRANALQGALRGHGFDAHVFGGNVGGKRGPMFRVVVSGFSEREEGAAVGRELQKLFREDTRLAQLGQ